MKQFCLNVNVPFEKKSTMERYAYEWLSEFSTQWSIERTLVGTYSNVIVEIVRVVSELALDDSGINRSISFKNLCIILNI